MKRKHLTDLSRALPPDEQGRNRYLDNRGYVRVGVGVHHPLASLNGYTTEGRLKLFEANKLLPDQHVWYRDGNYQNTSMDNLVAYSPSGPMPWRTQKHYDPVYCPCGCGQFTQFSKDGRPKKWIEGHKKAMNPFHSLSVTRERKRQLWNIAKGLCCACAQPRNGHTYYCERCRKRKVKSKQAHTRRVYAADPDYYKRQSRQWVEKNPQRYREYSDLRRTYGNKRDWPDEVKRFWKEKYPSKVQQRIAALGIRYERM